MKSSKNRNGKGEGIDRMREKEEEENQLRKGVCRSKRRRGREREAKTRRDLSEMRGGKTQQMLLLVVIRVEIDLVIVGAASEDKFVHRGTREFFLFWWAARISIRFFMIW